MKILLRFFFDKFLRKNNFFRDIVVRIYYYSGYPIYKLNKILNRPYIGNYLFSDQEAGRKRLSLIRLIFTKINKKKINILELGVYCGQNTLSISSLNQNFDVSHFCVDIFRSYNTSDTNDDFRYKKYCEILESKKVYNLFLHNLQSIKKKNKNIKFFIKKMTTEVFFSNNSHKFDFIIIDANHQFDYVYKDIVSSKKLLNNNGFIIGDDYEIEAKNLSFTILKKNKNSDLVYDKKSNKSYHPGVTLAVKKAFKNLKSKNGMFCLQKKNNIFIDFFKISKIKDQTRR